MNQNRTGLPPGFRDLLFDEAESRRKIETGFAAILGAAGYREVVPSGVEFADLYQRGRQGVRERSYKFLDRDDNLLALRADFTPAIARIVAGRLREARLPVKLWYSGPVFRKTGRLRGQFHEFHQIGAELIGTNTAAADGEILSVALRCLTDAGVRDACVHVNHAGVFRGIVKTLGLEPAPLAQVKSEIDRKDMRALSEKLDDLGIHASVQAQVRILARCVGDSRILKKAGDAIVNEESSAAIAHLQTLASSLPEWQSRIVFDLTEIDEMEYYSGVMFTFFSPSHTGELGKGGRYDTLLKEFGPDLPAVGFSLLTDRISECL